MFIDELRQNVGSVNMINSSLNGWWVIVRTSKWLIHTQTHTHTLTDTQTGAMTIPEGQNWPRVKTICTHPTNLCHNSTLKWRHNERDAVSNHQPHNCLFNRLFKAQIKENIKGGRYWPLCGEFTGHRWILRTHKGQVTRKMFLFDDVIMINMNGQNPAMLYLYIYKIWGSNILLPWALSH